MTRTYRPAVAWPIELEQEDQHFASGVNHPGEAHGLAMSGRHIGITATELRPGLLEELELSAGGMVRLFVDSGAFSEVAFSPATGRLEIVRLITDADWVERFDLYTWAALTFRTRAYIVAPDCVGNQDVTLARLERWAPHVAAIAALRANVIVPVQKGTLPMSAMFARACAILNLREMPIAGPSPSRWIRTPNQGSESKSKAPTSTKRRSIARMLQAGSMRSFTTHSRKRSLIAPPVTRSVREILRIALALRIHSVPG